MHRMHDTNEVTSFRIREIRRNFASHYFRGDGEIRTHDPLLARQVLSQLSYTPKFDPATTYSPTSSPMQYHRPLKS